MKSKNRPLVVAVVSTLVLGVAALDAAPAIGRAEVGNRPTTCVIWGNGTFTPSDPGFVAGLSLGRGYCSNNIGTVRVRGEQTQNLATGAYDGTFTTTAADGSTLFGTYSGAVESTAHPKVFKSKHVSTTTGGTGRFAGASGTATVTSISVVVSEDPATGVTRTKFASISIGP
jgi:hypothetical protein